MRFGAKKCRTTNLLCVLAAQNTCSMCSSFFLAQRVLWRLLQIKKMLNSHLTESLALVCIGVSRLVVMPRCAHTSRSRMPLGKLWFTFFELIT